MRATALFIIGILYGYASMLAQIQEPVKFTVEDRKVSDNQLELVFSAIIEKGWHVYGTDIPEDGPTAAALTITDIHGLKTDGKFVAQGKELRVMDEMYGMELSYFEGKVSFVQRFTITDSKYSAEGYLSYG
ncbi:MAG: thiol:disulfide interchange protein, partial [Bacteroidaceae bacterium]